MNTFLVVVSVSGSLTVICCVVVTFLVGSYVKPVNSNDILGNVIATDLFKFGDCSNLAKNFPIGPYASGTLLTDLFPSESVCLIEISLNNVPKEIIVFLNISL